MIDALVAGHVNGIAKYLGLTKKEAAQVNDKVTVIVNGKNVDKVKLIDGETYVPLRFVSETLGAKVDWDNKTKAATVTK
ncbi:hypothetical protein D3C74_397790 [compost metagenome]